MRKLMWAMLGLTVAALVLASGQARANALVGTTDDGNLSIFIPSPSQGLPDPQLFQVSGLPAGARPHGSAIVDVDRGLVADFLGNRIFVVGLQPAQLVATIPTPTYLGLGTLAVSPDQSVALASGFEARLTVIRAPFGPGSAQNEIGLPAAISGFATQNIDFDPQGRAYVRHVAGISVIDPPYQAVAFTIPLASLLPGGIAVSADGSRLITGYVVPESGLVDQAISAVSGAPDSLASLAAIEALRTEGAVGPPRAGIDVAELPLTPASTLQRIELFRCNCLAAGVAITPDSQRALLALLNTSAAPDDDLVFSLPSPFTDAGSLETLPLPPGFPVAQGFEDIGISADGSEAMIVGQSAGSVPGAPAGLPALHIRAPFTAAGAQLSPLNLPGGRGAGSVRYAPAGIVPPPPPRPAVSVPLTSPLGLVLMLLALWALAAWRLRG